VSGPEFAKLVAVTIAANLLASFIINRVPALRELRDKV
jgi:hypothetical protein